jgi:hypothetical protein
MEYVAMALGLKSLRQHGNGNFNTLSGTSACDIL